MSTRLGDLQHVGDKRSWQLEPDMVYSLLQVACLDTEAMYEDLFALAITLKEFKGIAT